MIPIRFMFHCALVSIAILCNCGPTGVSPNECGDRICTDDSDLALDTTIETIATTGDSAHAGERFREIGNFLCTAHDTAPMYRVFYSGYEEPYRQDAVYVGMLYSMDGVSWKRESRIVDRPLEDPYVVVHGGTLYLYAEDKLDVPFRDIRLFTSADGTNWDDRGDILSPGTGWESVDVSSPTVWIENGQWYMLYEGRGAQMQGAIGLARSKDGIAWEKEDSLPVIAPDNSELFAGQVDIHWASSVVPDDIIWLPCETTALLFHGFDGSAYRAGLVCTRDFMTWQGATGFPLDSKGLEVDGGILMFADTMVLQTGQGISISVMYADSTGMHTTNLRWQTD